MYVLVVTIDIKPQFKDRFLAEMLDDAHYEVYADRAAFDVHMTTPHFLKWKDAVQDWLAAPPVVGAGPSVFPADGDWNKNSKAR